MSIIEAIKELEKQRDIAIEKGLDPNQISVLIPHRPAGGPYEDLEDSELFDDGGTWDLWLKG